MTGPNGRLPVDTHVFPWSLTGRRWLSEAVLRAFFEPASDKLTSAASAWEISTKHRLGGLPEAAPIVVGDIAGVVARRGLLNFHATLLLTVY